MSQAVPESPYPKAPIVEAVIHVSVGGVAQPEELQKVMKRLRNDYPEQEPLSGVNVIVDPTGGGSFTVQQQQQGHRAKSIDQADIVMVLQDGVGTARLAPYLGWDHLRDRARKVWSDWRKIVAYSAPKRIGIRYINRIDVPIRPGGILDIDTYLNSGPRVPDFSRHPVSGFVAQIARPTDLDHWSTNVTSTTALPPPLIDHVSFVLDIDVFRTEDIPGREADLWECVEAVRPLKNKIFESCITDEARRLFA
jgi:uncharacterized protein (TIGR04255 family)